MLNRVFLIGRLTADPILRYTGSGVSVATFSVAVDNNYQTASGESKSLTDFIDVVVWSKLAVVVATYLKKGRLVFVEGRLTIRSFETQDGQKRKKAEVVARSVKFLERATTASDSLGSPELPESGDEEFTPEDLSNDIPIG